MKLTNSTELRQYVCDNTMGTDPSVRAVIAAIQAWLDEHGYVVVKSKETIPLTTAPKDNIIEGKNGLLANANSVFENKAFWEVFKGYLEQELKKGEREFSLRVSDSGTFSIYPEKEAPKNQDNPIEEQEDRVRFAFYDARTGISAQILSSEILNGLLQDASASEHVRKQKFSWEFSDAEKIISYCNGVFGGDWEAMKKRYKSPEPEPRNKEWPNRTKSGNELVEKGTVSFKEVEEYPWDDPSIDTMDKLQECALSLLQNPKYALPLTSYIDLLKAKSIKEGRMLLSGAYVSERAKRKELQDYQDQLLKNLFDTCRNTDLNEPKPSADGEENPYAGFFSPMGVDWKKVCFPKEEKNVSFVPFQKCPVCDGNGTRFDTAPFSNPMNTVMCHCCSGSGCIPMCKQTK